MAFTTLIDTATLATHLADPGFAIVDCRFALNDDDWGGREYAAQHIPGAVFAHLGHDLAGAATGQNGRHPLPDPAKLAMTFGRLGIGDDMQVVAYDQDSGMYADRVSALIGMSDWLLVDARAPERYRGDAEPIDKVAGHIPGAVNHPFKSNLTETGAFRS